MRLCTTTPTNGSFGHCPAAGIQSGFDELRQALAAWRGRTARRRAALAIDSRTLADIGLTRAHVDYEAAKPFWRA